MEGQKDCVELWSLACHFPGLQNPAKPIFKLVLTQRQTLVQGHLDIKSLRRVLQNSTRRVAQYPTPKRKMEKKEGKKKYIVPYVKGK